jgi:hypothetical protein
MTLRQHVQDVSFPGTSEDLIPVGRGRTDINGPTSTISVETRSLSAMDDLSKYS